MKTDNIIVAIALVFVPYLLTCWNGEILGWIKKNHPPESLMIKAWIITLLFLGISSELTVVGIDAIFIYFHHENLLTQFDHFFPHSPEPFAAWLVAMLSHTILYWNGIGKKTKESAA